jgi:hypothetical protein
MMSNSNDSGAEDVDDDDSVCVICGGTPCEWVEFGGELVARQSLMATREMGVDGVGILLDSAGRPIQNNRMRLHLYRLFTYLKFGHLGRGNRIPIPSCVTSEIRKMYPDPDADYTEFRPVSKKRRDEVSADSIGQKEGEQEGDDTEKEGGKGKLQNVIWTADSTEDDSS